MPHKQNPVASRRGRWPRRPRVPGLVATMLAAMVQEDERGLGGWHAEWETLPELVGLTGGALHQVTETMAGLRVDAARMAANLEATRGLVFAEAVQMALGRAIGRAAGARCSWRPPAAARRPRGGTCARCWPPTPDVRGS